MFSAAAARSQGDSFQARWFWIQACRLFLHGTAVEYVAYEYRLAPAFDDVVTFYNRPITDEHGDLIQLDCFQTKFHVDHRKQITAMDLIKPEFIGATRISLLQRLHLAYQHFQKENLSARFYLILPWHIHENDPLGELVSNQGGEIRLQRLRDGGPRSKMGKVRQAWREHLSLTDDALEAVLRRFRIRSGYADLELIRQLLNASLQLAGLVPITDDQIGHRYDELIRKLLERNLRVFDRAKLQEIAKREGLWREPQNPMELTSDRRRLGIRSFVRFAEYMEDETDTMVSLVHHFDNRRIVEPRLWVDAVYPEVVRFLTREVQPDHRYLLFLDCHSSIAFAAGYTLLKSGADVAIVQKLHDRREVWYLQASPVPETESLWEVQQLDVSTWGVDTALAVSITHPVQSDVEAYVRSHLPSVGRILSFTVRPEPGYTVVRDGGHTMQLAQTLVRTVNAIRTPDERGGMLHIFGSMPNAFAFALGKIGGVLGQCTIYEHNFDSSMPRAYEPSLRFPPLSGAANSPV